ncbi:hypothetical protein F5Y17DRAFT_275240 [Xylariaceae sp. FL0594]|nr:hypothetical protein F5Y17DRAFT_275240 [Xylariaceae sp. FL0594]
MAEVMRYSPALGTTIGGHQQHSHMSDTMDVLDVSNRLMAASLQQQQQQQQSNPTSQMAIQKEEEEKRDAKEEGKEEPKKNMQMMRDGVLRTADGGVVTITPRRAFTTSEYLLPTAPVSRVSSPALTPRDSSSTLVGNRDSYFQQPSGSAYPHSPSPVPSMGGNDGRERGGGNYLRQKQQQMLLATAALATTGASPLRSYSVMDYEPIPFTHRPGVALQLAHLPSELHFAIFDFLDPIDSVCLALTSRHFYAIHWRLHGKVSLAARREGPNDMEWVWRHAGPFLLPPNNNNNNKKISESVGGGGGGAEKRNSLAMLSPRGQVYCRKCRTARCELNKHIREWMGPGLEYCLVTEKYGPPAQEGAKGFCYRSSPRHPNRCGRHTRNQRTIRLT